jgi:CRP/FNR family cyclic AMP-dependent transcriptional regulator
MTNLDQRVDLLRHAWLFSECTDDELSRIAGLAAAQEAAAGDELCVEGEPGDEFFVVVDGTAEAQVGGDTIAELGPGSFFGEMALIDGGDRLATITAKSPMQLLVLGRNDFNTMLSSAMPHVAPKLMQVMGQRIRDLQVRAGGSLPF